MAATKTKKTKTKEEPKPKNSTAEAIARTTKRSGKGNVYRVPSTRYLVRDVWAIWRTHWRPIFAVTAIYGAFYFIVVRGITAIDVGQLTTFIEDTFGAEVNTVGTSLILTGAILGLSSEYDQVSGLLTSMLFVINSLAMIWVLRHIWLERAISIRDSYYQGMYPLIPFMMILGIMLLQLIPFTAGGYITSTIFANEIAVSLFEKGLVILFFLFMTLVSAYLITGSLMAMYLVTIPDMTPMKAMRTAKEVLKKRRLLVLQRIMVYVIVSLVIAFSLLLIVVMTVAPLAPVLVTLLAALALPWLHTYLYVLYRHIIED